LPNGRQPTPDVCARQLSSTIRRYPCTHLSVGSANFLHTSLILSFCLSICVSLALCLLTRVEVRPTSRACVVVNVDRSETNKSPLHDTCYTVPRFACGHMEFVFSVRRPPAPLLLSQSPPPAGKSQPTCPAKRRSIHEYRGSSAPRSRRVESTIQTA
jgi:hypothetical protein